MRSNQMHMCGDDCFRIVYDILHVATHKHTSFTIGDDNFGALPFMGRSMLSHTFDVSAVTMRNYESNHRFMLRNRQFKTRMLFRIKQKGP